VRREIIKGNDEDNSISGFCWVYMKFLGHAYLLSQLMGSSCRSRIAAGSCRATRGEQGQVIDDLSFRLHSKVKITFNEPKKIPILEVRM